MLSILGFGSQSKLLSSPVPLGGKEGFEIGVSSEYIPVEDLSALGAREPSAKGELNALTLGLGKGLPYNVDTFVTLTPLPQSEGVFSYGAQLRWGFYEFRKFPGMLSLVFHGAGSNFKNQLDARTSGADLVMTVAMEDTSLYFGGGMIRSVGTFAGSITADSATADEDLSDTHTVFGISMNFGKMFFSLEVDRVTQSVYGGKIGFRL